MDDRNPLRQTPLVFAGLPPGFDIVAHGGGGSKTTEIAAYQRSRRALHSGRQGPLTQPIPRSDPVNGSSPSRTAHRTVAVLLVEDQNKAAFQDRQFSLS